MIQFQHTVTDPLGLHARPAGLLAALAGKTDSRITVSLNGKSAPAGSLIRVMSLGAVTGSVVVVTVEGGDEEASYRAVKEFFDTCL